MSDSFRDSEKPPAKATSKPAKKTKAGSKKRGATRKKLRVIVLMHEDLVPRKTRLRFRNQTFIASRQNATSSPPSKNLGHERGHLAFVMPSFRSATPSRNGTRHCLHLLDEFQGEAIYDQHVVAYLELLRVPYTGNNPRGLVLARDKALSKKSRCTTGFASRVFS